MLSSSADFCRPSGKVEVSSLCGLAGVVIRGSHSTQLILNCCIVTECRGVIISRSICVRDGDSRSNSPQKGEGGN